MDIQLREMCETRDPVWQDPAPTPPSLSQEFSSTSPVSRPSLAPRLHFGDSPTFQRLIQVVSRCPLLLTFSIFQNVAPGPLHPNQPQVCVNAESWAGALALRGICILVRAMCLPAQEGLIGNRRGWGPRPVCEFAGSLVPSPPLQPSYRQASTVYPSTPPSSPPTTPQK